MRRALLCLLLLVACSSLHAQHTLTVSVRDKQHQPLRGATALITKLQRSVVADSAGVAFFEDLPAGAYVVELSYVGFEKQTLQVDVPQPDGVPYGVALQASEEEEEEVIVEATRSPRPFRDLPTRVEVISGEELEEKANMKPGDIRMMLSESTGIQTQQTSATSHNSSIRIQGLDGRYTQILKDGFPLYAGFSGGLSLMQLVPLDLKQVEVVKGSSSTLYGGGAIAGLVNLVSKTPGPKRELNFLANATSAGGIDLSGFYSQRYGATGVTLLGSRNTTAPFDPAGIGFTAIPKSERYTINPRLYFYGKRTSGNVGASYISERRVGGSMDYIKHGTAGFFEENQTDRFSSQVALAHQLGDHARLNFRNSYSHFNRTVHIPSYTFEGIQQSSYSELTLALAKAKTAWIFGGNVLTDAFREQHAQLPRNYNYKTFGAFVQNTWTPSGRFSLETGIRGDYVAEYGFEWLPRASAMWRMTEKLTARIGAGFGYKTPTIFSEESERIQYRNIRPINHNEVRNERSLGANIDVNYSTDIGDVGVTINQLIFYTRLSRSLLLSGVGSGELEFVNSPGHLDTKGLETNLRFTLGDLKLFVGYTYANVNTHYDVHKLWLPLTARHRLNNVLMYEQEEKFKLGLEAYYVGPQRLNDGSTGRSYWTTGFMAEKIWKHFSLFVNFENFTDTRQTRFGPIYSGTLSNPVFSDIYAPLDGRVVNGGIKLRF